MKNKGGNIMNRNITYTEKDGYLYPDLELPEQKEVHIGIWGGSEGGDTLKGTESFFTWSF